MSHLYVARLTDEQIQAVHADGQVAVIAECASIADEQMTIYTDEALKRSVVLFDETRVGEPDAGWSIPLNPDRIDALLAVGGGFKNVPMSRRRPNGETKVHEAWVLGPRWQS